MVKTDNFSDIITSTLLPVGKYAFEVDACEESKANQNGKLYAEFKIRVIDGPDFEPVGQNAPRSTVGTTRFLKLYHPTIEQKDGGSTCKRNIISMEKALGLDVPEDGFDFTDAPGRQFTAQVKQKVDPNFNNGEPQEEFSNFKAYSL